MKNSEEIFVIAHNIRSLLNVGSIFRTADAFGVTRLYLTGYTGAPDNPVHASKIAKTALGAENFVPWEYSRSAGRLITKLKKEHPGIQIVGLENNVGAAIGRLRPLNIFKPTFPLTLILGEEVSGIGKSLLRQCDVLLEIPMLGQKESLNVSVAFGVAMYGLRNA